MGDAFTKPASDGTNSTASAQVICEEFLKVLSRKEVEQPMIWYVYAHHDGCSWKPETPRQQLPADPPLARLNGGHTPRLTYSRSQNLCLCAQLWRYQHYLLPLWPWGVTKIVCLGLGSFRDTISNGGPFTPPATTTTTTTAAASFSSKHQPQPQPTYRDVIRNSTLLAQFNARLIARHDALQAMLRHVAAIEIASMLKFCSSKRGIEHQLVKYHFKKLAAIAELSGSGSKLGAGEEGKVGEVDEVGEKVRKKLGKMPPTAGYAGDKDLVDVGVYLWDSEYTDEDREALGRLERVFEMAHLPPVRVVNEGEVRGLVDEHALVYAVDSGVSVKSVLLGRSRPAAMVVNPER
jgi:hypothetical protein